jgi:hypothetical protein
VARYLLGRPGETWKFDYQPPPTKLQEVVDADSAADAETRKSVSSVAERFGGHLLDLSIAKQSVLATSSGESEFYAIVKGSAQGLQTKQLLDCIAWPVELEILSDSSAARGMCLRSGSGKVKHLSIKELWVQELFRKKQASLSAVNTLINWGDIGTKALDPARLEFLQQIMPLLQREGLEGEVGKGKALAALCFLNALQHEFGAAADDTALALGNVNM